MVVRIKENFEKKKTSDMHVFMVCLPDVFIAWVAGALIQKKEEREVSY
jgi:hypothetical protein